MFSQVATTTSDEPESEPERSANDVLTPSMIRSDSARVDFTTDMQVGANDPDLMPQEIDGPKGAEPTRYGDWERNGRVSDF